MLEHTTDATLTTTDKEPTCSRCYAWHDSDGAMQLIQIKRSRNPGQANQVGVAFLQAKLIVDQHGRGMAKVSYYNIKRSEETLIGIRNTPHVM